MNRKIIAATAFLLILPLALVLTGCIPTDMLESWQGEELYRALYRAKIDLDVLQREAQVDQQRAEEAATAENSEEAPHEATLIGRKMWSPVRFQYQWRMRPFVSSWMGAHVKALRYYRTLGLLYRKNAKEVRLGTVADRLGEADVEKFFGLDAKNANLKADYFYADPTLKKEAIEKLRTERIEKLKPALEKAVAQVGALIDGKEAIEAEEKAIAVGYDGETGLEDRVAAVWLARAEADLERLNKTVTEERGIVGTDIGEVVDVDSDVLVHDTSGTNAWRLHPGRRSTLAALECALAPHKERLAGLEASAKSAATLSLPALCEALVTYRDKEWSDWGSPELGPKKTALDELEREFLATCLAGVTALRGQLKVKASTQDE